MYVIINLESYCPTQFSEWMEENFYMMDFRYKKIWSYALYFRNINLARKKKEKRKERALSTPLI